MAFTPLAHRRFALKTTAIALPPVVTPGERLRLTPNRLRRERSRGQQIDKEKTRVYAPTKRTSGTEWKEVHAGIARVMQYYVSEFKTENLFKIGLSALQKIEKEEFPRLYALDPHKLMRTLEDNSLLSLCQDYHSGFDGP